MRSRLTAIGTASALAVLTLTLAGCGAVGTRSEGASGANGRGDPAPTQDGGNAAGKVAPPGTVGATGNQPGTTISKRVTVTRSRILTADLTVRAKSAGDVGSVADKAIALVVAAGGEVAGDRRNQDGKLIQADVVLKIPPAKYADTLNHLAKLGKELSRSAQSEDVTDEVVDVASRVASQTASVERIRRLLASAKNLGDIVTIEGELARRQADLESLKARQRALDSQTADATITLHVKSPNAAAASKKDEDKRGFLAGLDSGWTAFTASVTVLLTVVGAVLPFLVLVLLLLAGVWLALRRRRHTGQGGGPAPAPAP